jgi:hypothetical protein
MLHAVRNPMDFFTFIEIIKNILNKKDFKKIKQKEKRRVIIEVDLRKLYMKPSR